jgi:hypothetical protein
VGLGAVLHGRRASVNVWTEVTFRRAPAAEPAIVRSRCFGSSKGHGMPPRSSYAFLAAGPLMLAFAAFLALQQAPATTQTDRVAVLEPAAGL